MDMKMFEPDREKCSEEANRIFMATSGINEREGKLGERLIREATRVRGIIGDNIDIRIGYAYYDDVTLDGRTAHIGTQSFYCPAFEQIRQEEVKGAYVYALSVGDFRIPEEFLLDQLYADIWGSAFADAARFQFRDALKQKGRLSDSFGPGFYGMDVSTMTSLAKLLDFDMLRIRVHESGALLPSKSCAGIYFDVTDEYRRLRLECASCLGTRTTCKLCQVHGGRM